MRGDIPPLPYTSSWCGAWLSTGITLPLGARLAQWHSAGLRGSSPGRSWEFFSSQPLPDRLWGPPSLLSNGYQGLPEGKEAGA
jgi:hypothetical protein